MRMHIRGRHGFTRSTRQGFTLVELIVVIGIIALLVSLSIAAVMRVQNAQQNRATQDVVEKAQVALDTQYKALIAQASLDMNGGRTRTQDAQYLLDYVGGDTDTALALLTYARVRQSFPQTFAEVPVQGFYVGPAYYPVKSQFLAFQGATAPPGLQSAYQQSALLLYAAVAQTGAGGATFTGDATNANTGSLTVGSVSGTVFTDHWQGQNSTGAKQAIGFCRFGTNQELQKPPYVNGSSTLLDPLDPSGKLQFWASSNPTYATSAYQSIFCLNGDAANAVAFNGTNRRPVVYSVGPNQAYESLNNTAATGITKAPLDDILGYQLTQVGYKGTQ